MVFKWFGKGKKGELLFQDFRKSLEQLETVDQIMEDLLAEKEIDEEKARKKIDAVFRNLEKILQSFMNLLDSQRDKLLLYIKTSVEERDYLSEIDELNNALMKKIKKIHLEFHKDDFWKFIEESADTRKEIQEMLLLLEDKMQHFYKQSRESLEWNYKAGGKAIDILDFKTCIRRLGGEIIEGKKGKGSHFQVISKLFENTIGPSKKDENMIAAGTLKSFIEEKRNLIEPYLNLNYLKCYFYKKNKIFRNIFEVKYKHLFEI